MKKYIYIPSYDTGAASSAGKVNYRLKDGTPWRFWSDEFPEEYRHKAFLVTAAHHYKDFNYSEKYGFGDDVLRFGDSGGYQIARGTTKLDSNFVDVIFRWLENNSTVAMNLDIPPRITMQGKFNECLELSKKNFKYFADHQSGVTDFLNVMHGSQYERYLHWYNEVKDFPFQGWAIGGAIGNLCALLESLIVLLENGEFFNKRNKWVHLLGASAFSDFLVLAQIQKSLDEIGSHVTLSTDSSTPSRSSAFGLYYMGFSVKDLKFESTRLSNRFNTEVATFHRLPKFHPFDDRIYDTFSLEDMLQFKTEHYAWMVIHNFVIFKDAYNLCCELVYSDYGLLEKTLKVGIYKGLRYIDEVIKAPNPMSVYTKYKPFFHKLSRVLPKDNFAHAKESVKKKYF